MDSEDPDSEVDSEDPDSEVDSEDPVNEVDSEDPDYSLIQICYLDRLYVLQLHFNIQ